MGPLLYLLFKRVIKALELIFGALQICDIEPVDKNSGYVPCVIEYRLINKIDKPLISFLLIIGL
ncbi:hypothetical protein D3C87_1727190 [compost metagenome]